MKTDNNWMLIPKEMLEKLLEAIDYFKQQKANESEDILHGYISEEKAKELLGRKTTWFWQRRKEGLSFKKLGSKIYYKKDDLIALVEGSIK